MSMRRIAQGAEGVLMKGGLLGVPVVVKDRVKKGYRAPQLDEKLRRLRTRAEARLLHSAKKAGVLCPLVYEISDYGLAVSFVEGKLLLEKQDDTKLLKETGIALAKMHSADIVHGDFTTANVIVDEKGRAWVIDFGLGGFSADLEEKAVDVLLMKRSLGKPSRYRAFLAGYAKYAKAPAVLGKLKEIEMRGRYVVRQMEKA
mgnify:CR=1 FL=1